MRFLAAGCVFFAADLLCNLLAAGFFPERPCWIVSAAENLYWLSASYFSACWLRYTVLLTRLGDSRKKVRLLISNVPVVLMATILVINYFIGFAFIMDTDGNYIKGPFYFVLFAVCFGPILISSLEKLFRAHTICVPSERTVFYISSFIIFMPIVTSLAELYMPAVPVFCAGCTVSVVLLYMIINERLVSVDPLTKLNNRARFESYLLTRIHSAEQKSIELFLVMMDLDDFKSINDIHGHVEGDNALILTANAINRVCAKAEMSSCFIARYGGDEFVMVCECSGREEVEALCAGIDAELANQSLGLGYHLRISAGIAPFKSNYTGIKDFVTAADIALYNVKKTHSA